MIELPSGGCRPGLLARAVALALAWGLAASPALAAGLWLYEKGTPDVGTANAGLAARAQDATTALTNPAGMSRLDRPELMVGLQPLVLLINFQPDSDTTTTGPKGNPSGVLPMANAFYVHPLGKDWRVGFSLASGFGLAASYEDNWVGRYYVQESALLTLNLSPTVSYRVTDWLSVGVGFTAQWAQLRNEVAINNVIGPDGQLLFKDKSWGFGGGAGILVEPWRGTRFGLTYASPIKHSFKDQPSITDKLSITGSGGPKLEALTWTSGRTASTVDVDITVPQAVMFSAYHDLTDKWALMANVGWQNWARFGEVPIGFSGSTDETFTENMHFKDTWHVAVGAHYRFLPKWRLTAGFAYDSSPVSDENRSVVLPLDRQFRYAVGVIHEWTERITVGLAYEFLDNGSASVNNTRGPLSGTVSGSFSPNYVSILAFSLNARF